VATSLQSKTGEIESRVKQLLVSLQSVVTHRQLDSNGKSKDLSTCLTVSSQTTRCRSVIESDAVLSSFVESICVSSTSGSGSFISFLLV